MAEPSDNGLGSVIRPLVDEAASRFSMRLQRTAQSLGRDERTVLIDAFRSATRATVQARLGRLVLLELNVARLRGLLTAPDAEKRWDEFVSLSMSPAFLNNIDHEYPMLRARIGRLLANQIQAALELAQRVATDREMLGGGRLKQVEFGAGDSHNGGRTVTKVTIENRILWYKPRSVRADVILGKLVDELCASGDVPLLGVPPVTDLGAYGWAEHAPHRFCRSYDELREFYAGLGGWLAVMLLIGATDMHMENVIACGPIPVVIDCETLFAPTGSARDVDLGEAVDKAHAALMRVLSTSLLPERGPNGLDLSAAAALPGQQPVLSVPTVANPRTDTARLLLSNGQARPGDNRPEPNPRPEMFWGDLADGFDRMAQRVTRLDTAGRLEPALEAFRSCSVRYVPLATEDYLQLLRGLWHPAAFRRDASVVAEVTELLERYLRRHSVLSYEERSVSGLLSDLLAGDIPVHTFRAGDGIIRGPGGQVIAHCGDQVDRCLTDWRRRDHALESLIIRSSLIATTLDHSPASSKKSVAPHIENPSSLEVRRRAAAAKLAGQICAAAVPGGDGTATWIGVAPGEHARLGVALIDAYSGVGGIAVALACYQHAVSRGLADSVDALEGVLRGAVATLERGRTEQLQRGLGGFDGHASELWAWLALYNLRGDDLPLLHARDSAGRIARAVDTTVEDDIVSGAAGALVPLLHLAAVTGDSQYTDTATEIADRLASRARIDGDRAAWPTSAAEKFIGFAHGATGIGWALTRLGLATGISRWADLGAMGLAHDSAAFDSAAASTSGLPSIWCNGSTGIGLAHHDLSLRTGLPHHARLVHDAARHVQRTPVVGQSLCHGSSGARELLMVCDPAAADRTLHQLIADVENMSSSTPLTSAGLLNGLAGTLLHLLRSDSRLSYLPNPLLQQPGMASELQFRRIREPRSHH
ncbi:type 2 lanthipeptide synthetase LanM family protein [Streptomyces cinereoruber]|uniref:type 2 lanthipeptide synthetase LanM family protein n=1 Tax=Streptomyces cinereoruber TaxID=67260 RepID=UPI003639A2DB